MTEEAMQAAQAAAPKPLTLPKLFAPAAALYTALSAHGCAARLPIGGAAAGEAQSLFLRLAAPHAGAAPAGAEEAPRAALRFRAGEAYWTLFLEDFSLFGLHPIFEDPETAACPPESLPDELLAALAEDLLTPALATIGEALGEAVAFEGFVRDCASAAARAPQLLTLSMGLLKGEAQAQGSASANASPAFGAWLAADSPAAFQGLTAFLARPKSGRGFLAARLDAVPLAIALIGAEVKLGLADYGALGPGDIVCLEDWAPARGEILAVTESCGRRICESRCRLEAGAATLDEPWRFAAAEDGAARESKAAETTTENTMQTTDDIEVTLAFELERRTITVGELKSLEPGAVLRLTADPAAPVTIRANGAPIAKGRLVDLNGVIGVQLTTAQGDGARHVD